VTGEGRGGAIATTVAGGAGVTSGAGVTTWVVGVGEGGAEATGDGAGSAAVGLTGLCIVEADAMGEDSTGTVGAGVGEAMAIVKDGGTGEGDPDRTGDGVGDVVSIAAEGFGATGVGVADGVSRRTTGVAAGAGVGEGSVEAIASGVGATVVSDGATIGMAGAGGCEGRAEASGAGLGAGVGEFVPLPSPDAEESGAPVAAERSATGAVCDVGPRGSRVAAATPRARMPAATPVAT